MTITPHVSQHPSAQADGRGTAPDVIRLIAAVQAEIATTGIAKNRKNQSQGYQFRGIDDVYNAIAPILAKHGLVIIPRIVSRDVSERVAQSGSPLFNVTVEAEFDFISSHDGSMVTARSFGEAMDSADKATNKAMSAAYKYTAMQTFCIPTEGDNDADATTHEPAAPAQRPAPVNDSPDDGRVRVASVRIAKTGKNDRGEWKLIVVRFSNGVEATTLNEKLATAAKALMQSGAVVSYELEKTDRGVNLVLVEEVGG